MRPVIRRKELNPYAHRDTNRTRSNRSRRRADLSWPLAPPDPHDRPSRTLIGVWPPVAISDASPRTTVRFTTAAVSSRQTARRLCDTAVAVRGRQSAGDHHAAQHDVWDARGLAGSGGCVTDRVRAAGLGDVAASDLGVPAAWDPGPWHE